MVTQDKPSNITYRQQYVDLMTSDNINRAALNGRLDILKWLVQTTGTYPSQTIVDLTEAKGRMKTLEQLPLEETNINPADLAVADDQLKVLQWLAQQNIYPTPNRYGYPTPGR